MRGKSTISHIIAETTAAIWSTLQPLLMPSPNEAKWKRNAERYLELWNLPNCIGAKDGKHIHMKRFRKSGSLYFNYKGYFSVVLLACTGANALFTTAHVGDFSKNSDGSVLRVSTLGRMLEMEELHIPCPASLPMDESGKTFPYYFVADEAFLLKVNLMRPYPRRMLTNKRPVFNYRLSRARKSVECTIGILTVKFKIFMGQICCKEETVISIVKASVILLNCKRIQDGVVCEAGKSFAVYQSAFPTENKEDGRQQTLTRAQLLRSHLADYFLTPAKAIPP
jgi:hypothetical protein